MAHIAGLILTADDAFKKHVGRLLRSSSIPVSVVDAIRDGAPPELVVADIRGDAATGLANIERLRVTAPGAAIFAVASTADPDLILQSMRAGANEFFIWPPADDAFHGAIHRTASRRETAHGSRQAAQTFVFFGAKGGSGTTTVGVNCGVELARLSKRPTLMIDLKPGLGEVALFLGVRSRYSIVDAIDNIHRLDREFLKELVVKHKSGLEILAGSDNFDRPGTADGGAIEELLRLLAKQYDYLVIDAGSQINPCSIAAIYAADRMFLTANPDVPSVRNAQRLLERVRDLGATGDRVRLLLNRAAEPFPIPPKQIETALGHQIHHMFPSDYKTVSTALNSGVPLSLAGDSEIATQFDLFVRRVLDPANSSDAAGGKKGLLNIDRIASLW
jgi:pilus assembly protein CpaE